MYKLFENKKGTEKPIEIFVALFVILAVALVMLKLFQNQITQKQTELQTVQEEGKQKELLQAAVGHCQDRCLQAANNDCSLQGLASLCLTYGSNIIDSPDYLDLNSDGKKSYDTSYLPGIGICEDKVPCHTLIDSCCSRKLNSVSCKDILNEFWDQQNFETEEKDCLVDNLVKFGECDPDDNVKMWYNITDNQDESFSTQAEECST